jgi:hypothetical protein
MPKGRLGAKRPFGRTQGDAARRFAVGVADAQRGRRARSRAMMLSSGDLASSPGLGTNSQLRSTRGDPGSRRRNDKRCHLYVVFALMPNHKSCRGVVCPGITGGIVSC